MYKILVHWALQVADVDTFNTELKIKFVTIISYLVIFKCQGSQAHGKICIFQNAFLPKALSSAGNPARCFPLSDSLCSVFVKLYVKIPKFKWPQWWCPAVYRSGSHSITELLLLDKQESAMHFLHFETQIIKSFTSEDFTEHSMFSVAPRTFLSKPHLVSTERWGTQ